MISFDLVDFGYRPGRLVVKDLTWEVPRGVTVLLGPNGAGKSTLLNLAASATRPRKGSVSIGTLSTRRGRDLGDYRRRVAWLPQQDSWMPRFSVADQVTYVGWLKGMSSMEAAAATVDALKSVGLETKSRDKVSELSGGQRRRLGIAQALVHGAEVVLMDEPTVGLDPSQRANFRQLVREVSSKTHFVISTHQTEDLSRIADHVCVLSEGRFIWSGSARAFLDLSDSSGSDSERAEASYHLLLGRDS